MHSFVPSKSKIATALLFLAICIFTPSVLSAQVIDSLKMSSDSLSKEITTTDTILPQKIDTTIVQKNKPSHGKKTITGRIKDFTTSEPLSFTTVFFPGTGTGMKSDLDGKFKFELSEFPKDSISFSVIGYKKKTIAIDIHSNFQNLNIELERLKKTQL